MYTITAIAGAVTGARHLRVARNGQDAAASWAGDGAGAVVVCDGCGAGASSEVGARLGARLVLAATRRRLAAMNHSPDWAGLWAEVRVDVAEALRALAEAMTVDDAAQVVHEHLLFTIVAAAVAGDSASVWAIGDGGYAVGAALRVLGPFADNQPPYLGYDLVGAPAAAHLEVIDARAPGRIAVATDGVVELGASAFDVGDVRNPDALRRRLAVAARGSDRIDWDARRVVRGPAALQDDGALAVLRWDGQP